MNQIDTLTQENLSMKSTIKNDQDKLLRERKEKAQLQVNFNTLQASTVEINTRIQELNQKNKELSDNLLISEEKMKVLEHEK